MEDILDIYEMYRVPNYCNIHIGEKNREPEEGSGQAII
jgi:hypothetical protein